MLRAIVLRTWLATLAVSGCALPSQDQSGSSLSSQLITWLEVSRDAFHTPPDIINVLIEQLADITTQVGKLGDSQLESFRNSMLTNLRATSPKPIVLLVPDSPRFEFLAEFAVRGVDPGLVARTWI